MGHQGHRLAVGVGGGVLLCVASLVLRPACLRPVHLQKIGLLSVPVGVLGACGLLCPVVLVWAIVISLACVPCQDRDKGRKFSPLIFERGKVTRLTGAKGCKIEQIKNRPFVWDGLKGCVLFLLVSI